MLSLPCRSRRWPVWFAFSLAVSLIGACFFTLPLTQAQTAPPTPQITTIAPAMVRSEGGVDCVVAGSGFTTDIQVALGDTVIQSVQVTGPNELRFRVPAQAVPGIRTLSLQTSQGLAQREMLVLPKPLAELSTGEITTVAGGVPSVGDGRTVPDVSVTPAGLALDAQGNLLIADMETHRVRCWNRATGVVTTVAGNGARGESGDGRLGFAARLNGPSALAFDPAGNLLVADTQNYVIRRVEATSRLITTVAGNRKPFFNGDGGSALETGFLPVAVAVDRAGNLVIGDLRSTRVFRVDAKGIITTIVNGNGLTLGDDGPALDANLTPLGLAYDPTGNLLILDGQNHRIRRVDALSGIITTVAGNGFLDVAGDGGPATNAALGNPRGFCLDGAGNIFIAGSERVRRVDAQTGIITTVVGAKGTTFGDGGLAENATLVDPTALAIDQEGNLYIADAGTRRVRRVLAATKVITTLVGNGEGVRLGDSGMAIGAGLGAPGFIALDGSGTLLIGDAGQKRIRRVEATANVISTLAGNGNKGFSGDGGPATAATLDPGGMAVAPTGQLWVCDIQNNRVRQIQAGTGTITTFAGDGRLAFGGDGNPATMASLLGPFGLALDGSGNLFVADTRNSRIRRIDQPANIISTAVGNGRQAFGGDGSTADQASLNEPNGVSLDAGGVLYVADTLNHRIRRIEPCSRLVSTVAGDGNAGLAGDNGPATSASLNRPYGLVVDGAGDVFVADTWNRRIRRVDGRTRVMTTIAGTDSTLYAGDGGPATQASLGFALNGSLAIDKAGNLYLADAANNAVRVIKGAAKPLVAGTPVACVTISNAVFAKPNLVITGAGFGAAGAKVAVNGQDVSALLASQNDTRLMLKGNKKKFNLVKGLNLVTVTNSDGRSNSFELEF